MVRNPSSLFAVASVAWMSLAGGAAASPPHADDAAAHWKAIEDYCFKCHNAEDWAGSVAFDAMSPDKLADDAKIWEATVRKLRGGFMPPPGAKKRPDAQTAKALVTWLETSLDAAQTSPQPGRAPMSRLNRREYANAVRDLLNVEVNVDALLPADTIKNGFDNDAASLQVSPSFLDQYINAARVVALQAMGNPKAPAVTVTYGPINDMVISLPPRGTPGTGTQQLYKEGMPFGTRGGIYADHIFPADGDYLLTIGDMALGRDVPRMEFKNTVIALFDGKEFYRTDIGGDADQKSIDQEQQPAVIAINNRLRNIKFKATAGQHRIAVTFLKRSFAESDERFKTTAPEGGQERVQQVHAMQIRGPMVVEGLSHSPSRDRIMICHPTNESEERPCAEKIIGALARRAFRRPVTDDDMQPLLAFYERSRAEGGFDHGIRNALSAVLASPHFLYRAENSASQAGVRKLSDLELASRLSFFIWSSLPDEQLIDLAARNELSQPETLKQQVNRMLADARAKSLTDAFAFQWLNIARLDEIVPERTLFPYASGRLDPRPMFRQELSLFVDSVLRSDQPLTALLNAQYTYLNEPLAMLYGIENVKGGQFRRVELNDSSRYGLLGKGAILMLTANPDRTAPVLRGAWILERILGTPPAAPPPNVSPLPAAKRGQRALTMRERMAQHRTNASCFACHGVMDPLGLTLENFNTVGQFHDRDPVTLVKVDTSGVMPDGAPLSGPDQLREALAKRTDQFMQTITEKLMTYALGRRIDYYDMPTIRRIARQSAQDQYRFAPLVLQVVNSDAFRMRADSRPETKLKTAETSAPTPQVSAVSGAGSQIESNSLQAAAQTPALSH